MVSLLLLMELILILGKEAITDTAVYIVIYQLKDMKFGMERQVGEMANG